MTAGTNSLDKIKTQVDQIEAVVNGRTPLTKVQKIRYANILKQALNVTKSLLDATRTELAYTKADLNQYGAPLANNNPDVGRLVEELREQLTDSQAEETARGRRQVAFGNRIKQLLNQVEPQSTVAKVLSYRKTIAAVGVAILAAATYYAAKYYFHVI